MHALTFSWRIRTTQQISVRQGGVRRSPSGTPTHTRTATHRVHECRGTYTYVRTHLQHSRTHTTRTLTHDTRKRSFGQNLKDTSRKKVQVYHVAP